MEQTAFEKLSEGILTFIDSLNWLFIVVFIVATGIINLYSKSQKKGLNWLTKVPTALWVLLFGIVLAGLFWWMYDYDTKMEFAGLLFSVFVSMGIYKIGIDKVLKWIAGKLGLKFESKVIWQGERKSAGIPDTTKEGKEQDSDPPTTPPDVT